MRNLWQRSWGNNHSDLLTSQPDKVALKQAAPFAGWCILKFVVLVHNPHIPYLELQQINSYLDIDDLKLGCFDLDQIPPMPFIEICEKCLGEFWFRYFDSDIAQTTQINWNSLLVHSESDRWKLVSFVK